MADYQKQTWVNDDPQTPLSAARLTHMETGIDGAQARADEAYQLADAAPAPGEYVAPDDSRLTDARTPTAHKHQVADLTAGDMKMKSYGFDTGPVSLFTDGVAAGVTGGDWYIHQNQTVRGFAAFDKSASFKGAANTVTVEGTLDAVGGIAGKLIYGTGLPEGKVAAPVGALYVDRAITNGALVWAKQSGTGNTGWLVMHGDTGWRLLPLINGWASGSTTASISPAVRRIGNTVSLRLRNLRSHAATTDIFTTLPTDFLPPSADGGVYSFGGTVMRLVQVNTAGEASVVSRGTADTGAGMSVTWQTARPWSATPFSTPA